LPLPVFICYQGVKFYVDFIYQPLYMNMPRLAFRRSNSIFGRTAELTSKSHGFYQFAGNGLATSPQMLKN